MDKKNQHRRSRRQNKITEDNFWDCSVCTYRNTAEAFKCLMCDVRKGTSTRKPRINPQLVAQQVAQQYTQSLPKVKKESAPGSVASSSTPTTTPTPVSTPTLPISTPAVFTASSSNSMSTVTVTTAAAPATITTPATSTVTSTITTTNNNNNTSSSTPAVSSKVEPSPPPPPSVIAAPVIPPAVAATAAAPAVAVATPGNKPEKIRAPSVDGKSTSSRRLRPKLKNVDRSRSECQAVTVNNVTVIITEFQPKRHYSSLSDRAGHQPSSGPTAPGFNHSNGGGVGGGGGNVGDLGTFQMEGSPAENGLHPDLSHKHQRLAL